MSNPIAKVLLIVADNPAHRVLFNRYLGKTPHHLVFATDGEDGYDRFAEVKPDLVIAHLNVARLDGTILCQLLRQQPRGDQVPVLLIGEEGADDARIQQRLLAVGADRFLQIPFSARMLLDCIGPLLAEGRSTQLQVELEHPVPASMSADLTLAPVGGLDFPERTGGSLADPGASLMESGDLPVPRHGEAVDVDTVVSFQNPFYEEPGPTVVPASPAVAPPSLEAGGDTARQSFEPGVGPGIGRSPVPRINSVVTLGMADPAPPERKELFEEQPISETGGLPETPAKDLSTKSRMLLEPQIGEGPGLPRATPKGKESSGNLRLIQELPREERTPTGERSDSPSKGVPAANAAVRRGLDESQLGKRLAKRVRTMHRLLDEVDYYQLLGLEPGANLAQLRGAYFDLSLEFHPDRFFLIRSGELKEKIYAIYRRVQEAYRVLADEVLRREYDQSRSSKSEERPAPATILPPQRPAPLGAANDSRAGALAGHAEDALREGDLDRARMFLHLARHYDPKSPAVEAALKDVVARLGPTI